MFNENDKVMVVALNLSFHGDVGTIEKYVPFGKWYVNLQRNGRQLVATSNLVAIASFEESWWILKGGAKCCNLCAWSNIANDAVQLEPKPDDKCFSCHETLAYQQAFYPNSAIPKKNG